MSRTWEFSGAASGGAQPVQGQYWSAQLKVTGTGAVTATVIVEATNTPGDSDSWQTLDTLTVSGTAPQRDFGVGGPVGWASVRSRCTGLTGTGAAAVVVFNAQ